MPSSLGPAEILVILVVALIVLGPSKLPEAGRQVGKALTEIRRWTQDVKSEMTGAFDAEPPRAQTATPSAAPVFDPMPSPMPTPTPIPPADAAADTPATPLVPKLSDAPTAPIEDALIQPPPAAPVTEPDALAAPDAPGASGGREAPSPPAPAAPEPPSAARAPEAPSHVAGAPTDDR
jgi:Tat protein translocase TatB subunit